MIIQSKDLDGCWSPLRHSGKLRCSHVRICDIANSDIGCLAVTAEIDSMNRRREGFFSPSNFIHCRSIKRQFGGIDCDSCKSKFRCFTSK
jgi:hypothetical protein